MLTRHKELLQALDSIDLNSPTYPFTDTCTGGRNPGENLRASEQIKKANYTSQQVADSCAGFCLWF